MRFCLLLVLFVILTMTITAQPMVHPGGVKGASFWLAADSALPRFNSLLDGDTTKVGVSNAARSLSFNFQPAVYFSPHSVGTLDLRSGLMKSMTLFSVYQAMDTSVENSVWHIYRNQKLSLVQTTSRLADLENYAYMNYREVSRKDPKVNVYTHHKPALSAGEGRMFLGIKPSSPNLPIYSFKGLIPEIVAYNRVLSSSERLRVASYLSLKYGITLSEPEGSYVSSSAMSIWEGRDYPEYHHNIAGIGRDDSSNLKLIKASSSNEPGLLTITSRSSLTNQSFLVWGNNNRELKQAPKEPGLPVTLERRWLMVPSGNMTSFEVDVRLNVHMLDVILPANPVFWLVVDSAGSEMRDWSSVRIYRMSVLNQDGIASFKAVQLGRPGIKREVVSIIAGASFFSITRVTQPTCREQNKGKISIRMVGGVPPYHVKIYQASGGIQEYHCDSEVMAVPEISSGRYKLEITDALRQNYKDSFNINYADIGLPSSLRSQYLIQEGEQLSLDASASMSRSASYQWSGPSNFRASTASVRISEGGNYLVKVTADGCSNYYDINVKVNKKDLFADLATVKVFPNPSPGLFITQVLFPDMRPVTISIYAADGRLVAVKKGEGRSAYQFSHELNASGVYRIVFTSGRSSITKTLVIN